MGDAPAAAGRSAGEVLALVRDLPGLDGATGVTPLCGMTNSTWRVDLGGGHAVVRLAAGGADPVVDRRVELHNQQLAHARGLAPGVLHADPVRDVLVTEFVAGRELTAADLTDPRTLVRVGGLLRSLHALPPRRFRGRFAPLAVAERYAGWLAAAGAPLTPGEAEVLDGALALRGPLAAGAATATCHNDPWSANILDADGRLVLIDWEYSGVGDPLWDLAHFAAEARLDPDGVERLLTAWCGGPPPPPVRARLQLWLPVTDVVWALWARVQHEGGNRRQDLRRYAAQRLRRARRAFAGGAVARAAATVARGVGGAGPVDLAG